MSDLSPIDFLNPLTPIRMAAEGAGHAMDLAGVAAAAAREGAAAGLPGMSFLNPLDFRFPELPDLGKAGDDINKLATKALIGEAILIGGIVAIAGIAAWYLSKSPEARESTKAALAGGKFLLTKGRG